MSNLDLFIPITKVDAAQRLVYGLATAEIEDRSGEICDYASTKPLYEQWSEEIARSTGGKSLGNLRAMHGAVAAGKVTALNFNDAQKQIEICAKVVDDDEWRKVEEGVYTGFSQGGAYARRWSDSDGRIRYTAQPSEISLVDLPCLPQARFEMIKRDGTRELRPFVKGMCEVQSLSGIIEELDCLQRMSAAEERQEMDGSDVPGQLQDLLARACTILRGMVAEETDELLHRDELPAPKPAPAAPAKAAALHPPVAKIGARNSAEDLERIQMMHDTSVALGAACTSQKVAGISLDKRFDRILALVSDVLARVKNIESQPLPLPLAGHARAVGKQEDGQSTLESEIIEKLLNDPDKLAMAAIKLSQRNGRAFLKR